MNVHELCKRVDNSDPVSVFSDIRKLVVEGEPIRVTEISRIIYTGVKLNLLQFRITLKWIDDYIKENKDRIPPGSICLIIHLESHKVFSVGDLVEVVAPSIRNMVYVIKVDGANISQARMLEDHLYVVGKL